ncbi:MAG: Gfo/Idh/MocA family oxidoreductase [Planctomycetota bacterium]|nr:Gfo/Idh/MocA family oxidoreductase [Planctomycetota bacterium]MDP7135158.1 Gfo/Idh/MocA family oxidoreductase [Planctomycetota bacterium]MDP7252696.1 Gfo/Idh/MocA family oxidoreductase [Planctomycetota bacterium]
MSKPVRMGVIGTGSVAVRGILPHLVCDDVQDSVNVTAVCDLSPGRAQAAAERFGAPHYFEDFEALLKSGTVDAVSLATPIGLHYEQGKAAIENGLHVHFNKTMTTTAAEADELIALAARNNVRLVASPGQMLRPVNRAMRTAIKEGGIGKVIWAITGSAFGRYHENEKVRLGDDPLSNINPSWYYKKPGGGPLFDMTVYGLHALTGILGPAKRVTAMSGIRLPQREFMGETYQVEMDDNTVILIDFGDALFGFVYGVVAGSLPVFASAIIYGTNGKIENGNLNGKPIDFPERAREQERGWQSSLPHVQGEHMSLDEPHVYEDVMQLVDWIREDKPSIVTAEHARHVVEIFDAAYRSAETGQAQDLKTTFEEMD